MAMKVILLIAFFSWVSDLVWTINMCCLCVRTPERQVKCHSMIRRFVKQG
jgi:hypothetical protein